MVFLILFIVRRHVQTRVKFPLFFISYRLSFLFLFFPPSWVLSLPLFLICLSPFSSILDSHRTQDEFLCIFRDSLRIVVSVVLLPINKVSSPQAGGCTSAWRQLCRDLRHDQLNKYIVTWILFLHFAQSIGVEQQIGSQWLFGRLHIFLVSDFLLSLLDFLIVVGVAAIDGEAIFADGVEIVGHDECEFGHFLDSERGYNRGGGEGVVLEGFLANLYNFLDSFFDIF